MNARSFKHASRLQIIVFIAIFAMVSCLVNQASPTKQGRSLHAQKSVTTRVTTAATNVICSTRDDFELAVEERVKLALQAFMQTSNTTQCKEVRAIFYCVQQQIFNVRLIHRTKDLCGIGRTL